MTREDDDYHDDYDDLWCDDCNELVEDCTCDWDVDDPDLCTGCRLPPDQCSCCPECGNMAKHCTCNTK